MERRRVLVTLGAAGAAAGLQPLLAACTSGSSDSSGPTASPTAGGTGRPLDPREGVAAGERELLSRAADIEARWPATAEVLAPLQEAHTAHVVALVGSTPTPTPQADSSGRRLPATAAAALLQLAADERAAATRYASAAATADPSSARLIASIAAYSAAQDVVLTRASTTVGIGR